MLVPFGAEAQTKPATNLDQANQMIVLLQKQLLVLQQQLSEMKESNKKSSKTVYYASLSTEWNTKEAKSCYAITIAEDDGTAAIDEKISIVVVDKNTAVASLRKGKTFTLKTDEFGKATHCGNATKITVKKGDLLKQDKSFSTEGLLETADSEKKYNTQALTQERTRLLEQAKSCYTRPSLACNDVSKRIGEIDKLLGTSSVLCFYEKFGKSNQLGRTCGG